jgi:SAM-dependent methyltransferase
MKKLIKKILIKIQNKIRPPLENLPGAPAYFSAYRYFENHPEMKRFPGGWEYQNRKYPDYLFVGGASYAIFPVAKKYLKGNGIDIGAGFWEYPGSIPVDSFRGEGMKKNLDDFSAESLDYIFSSHCLEHIANWQEELKHWIALLKKGGILFLYLPHPDCGIWRRGAPGIGDGHKWIPDFKSINDFLLNLGMKKISEDKGPDGMMSFYICVQK